MATCGPPPLAFEIGREIGIGRHPRRSVETIRLAGPAYNPVRETAQHFGPLGSSANLSTEASVACKF